MRLDTFSSSEVQHTLRKLDNNKAPGPDGVPPEFWKALSDNADALQQVTDFVNMCWVLKTIPASWRNAQITCIHKKGRTDDCQNYRPISLLAVGYKVFAALLHQRLVEAGAEGRLSSYQFGFRSGHSTQNAIFILRRLLEQAWAQRDGSMVALALDWQRAFDSINPSAMIIGLRRFGLPDHVLDVIKAIYTDRCFRVHDCGIHSQQRSQLSGIAQGCPLSPFLFVMIMTVVMEDAVEQLPLADRQSLQRHTLGALLYADDTLLFGCRADAVQRFLAAVQKSGKQFGLELHAKKFQLIQAKCNTELKAIDGLPIIPKEDMVYLGAVITSDGRVGRELARRLGAANAEFRALARLWRHAAVSRRRKIDILNATVIPKLLYSLMTACLNLAERRRLDGFHNRCLRLVWGIQPALISRVSNSSVLQITQQKPLTHLLARQQLMMFGKVARAPAGSLLRDSTFCPGSLRPAADRYIRRVGRPRLEWAKEVTKMALKMCGSFANLENAIRSETT